LKPNAVCSSSMLGFALLSPTCILSNLLPLSPA
jgi:hypothetical protein